MGHLVYTRVNYDLITGDDPISQGFTHKAIFKTAQFLLEHPVHIAYSDQEIVTYI